MATETKMTHNTDEVMVRRLFDKNMVYQVPLFQRPYRWLPKKVKKFQSDLVTTLETEDGIHFFGAIIIHRVPTAFRDIDVFEIIDGQQRLTTIYLHLAAAAKVLASTEDGLDEALRIVLGSMINNEFNFGKSASLKLQPSREDRHPLNSVIKDVIGTGGLASQMSGKSIAYLTQMATTPSPRVEKNFDTAVKFFREQQREFGNARIVDLVGTIEDHMSVVVIDVIDPLSGPKIFDSLNSGQEKMTVGDLVRNDIFARVADVSAVTQVETNHWKPFFEGFGDPAIGLFEDYFFPFGLISNPNVKKADVYQKLREGWTQDKKTAVDVITGLEKYQQDYMMLRADRELADLPAVVRGMFRRFFLMGATTAVLPFLMRLSYEVRHHTFPDQTCRDIMEVIDSFLTRRAVVGIEPTGLHAVFRSLWVDAEQRGAVNAQCVGEAISAAKTVQWPSHDQFRDAVRQRKLYGVKVTGYVLLELNRALGGDAEDTVDFWIEHVLPQAPGEGWGAFSGDQRESMTDTLGNLLPLTQAMNQTLSNGPYPVKRPVFKKDSKYKMTRAFAAEYVDWTPEALQKRSDVLASAAANRWPHGPASGA